MYHISMNKPRNIFPERDTERKERGREREREREGERERDGNFMLNL